MKKVLIITYYWPPSGGAGVQRWLKFVKYLRDFGWEPIVYTPENPEPPVTDDSLSKDIPDNLVVIKQPIREPYSAYKRFIGHKKEDKIQAGFLSEKRKNRILENISVWIRGNFFIPDARKWWIKPSVKFLKGYLAKNPVDAIVSTGPPHSMHMIAYELKNSLNLPWLADFRDPWTKIDFYDKLKLTRWADQRHKKLEKKILKSADKVSTISWGCAEDFNRILPRDYEVVTNGFDPDDFKRDFIKTDDYFSITHVGSLNKDRNPDFLWKVISEIRDSDPDFRNDLRLRFIGKNDISLTISLEQYNLINVAEIINYIPHDSVIKETARSQVLLLLLNNTPDVKGIISGKIFEYLATRRPVLVIGPTDGDAARIIEVANAGIVCDFEDEESVKRAIWDLYRNFKSVKLVKNEVNIDAFSRKNLTAEIADLLNEICKP